MSSASLSEQHTATVQIRNPTDAAQYNDTVLLRQIRDNTGEIAQGMKNYKDLSKDTKEIKITQEYLCKYFSTVVKSG